MAPDLQKKVDKARAARLAREAAMKGQVDAQVSCIVLVNKVKIQVVFLVILFRLVGLAPLSPSSILLRSSFSVGQHVLMYQFHLGGRRTSPRRDEADLG